MATKIILFLSDFNPKSEETQYVCPDGQTVTGQQTNDAPVKYLLQTHPEISEILCIVTPRAAETTWERFQQIVQVIAPGLSVRKISFEENEDFTTGPLTKIMTCVKSGDEILLETTGGFRNAIMHLLLLSRVLSYTGVRTIGAVYSNHPQKRVEDISHLIRLFDLVGGMQELTNFGSVRTLRTFYGAQCPDEKIERLLTAVEQLLEAITLCRTRLIDDRMQTFDEALKAAETCADPLMQELLPAFRGKFGKKLTTPGLIKWCVESDMLQQALTIYKERMPVYLLKTRNDILEILPDAPPPRNTKDYEDESEARFYEHFLKMGRNMRTAYYGADPDQPESGRKDYTVTTLEHLEELLPHSHFVAKCPVAQLKLIAMDYLYIRALRNMTNHANEQSTESQAELMTYLTQHGYLPLERVSADDLRNAILLGLEHLKVTSKKEKSR
ncbi:MAG: TM1812 family CRISPR-associated protein [Oscillospiraceae bacterium]